MLTNSANFIFLFTILNIIAAEFGGWWAAITSAIVSALSLDFFLTRPYLSLMIAGKHDLMAFGGLAVCGLVVAAFSARRRRDAASRRPAQPEVAGQLPRRGDPGLDRGPGRQD